MESLTTLGEITTELHRIQESGGRKLLCLEVNPPRGVDTAAVLGRLSGQLEGIDFLNVTDCALAKLKCAPFPFAALLKQQFRREVLVNLSCRDRNLLALQADLLGGWISGVRSVIALTGDAMSVGDSPERQGVFEVNSVGLLQAIRTLNSGRDLAGHELKGAPGFYPGVVVNPNARNVAAELRRLERKRDAGARYALSQPVFDIAGSVNFFRECAAVGVPTFVGLLPLKNAHSIDAVTKIPGIRVAEGYAQAIAQSPPDAAEAYSLDFCCELASAVSSYVRGFHVVSGAAPLLALRLAHKLVELLRSL